MKRPDVQTPTPRSSRRLPRRSQTQAGEEVLTAPAAKTCWPVVKLREVCALVGETVNPQQNKQETFAHYSIPAFDDGRRCVFEPGEGILSNKVEFPNGVVLFSKLNPRIARVWFVSDEHKHRRICSTEFLPLQPALEKLDCDYLVFALQEPTTIAALRGGVQAATKSRERLKPELVLKAPLALPPLAEQRRIAGRLREQMAEVERARVAVQTQLEAAEALPAALLRAHFTTPVAQRWPRRRLGDLLMLRKEVVHPSDQPKGQATFVGLEHVEPRTGKRIGGVELEMADLTGRKPRFRTGDIVYGYLRPYLNKVWVADFDGLCSVDQYSYSVRRELADTSFVAWFMRSPTYLERAPIGETPGQLPRIRLEEVAAVEIKLPPLAEQRTIAERIEAEFASFTQLRSSLQARLSELERLPAALLRAAFSGQ